ncbi:MAG TPA: sugar phosphate isomerase/epimerase family protein [Lacipirellulaceae bacterium]|nr:sugar phosphate isomerase/epimerase family protein [Lacipirellulaceae bacterium]
MKFAICNETFGTRSFADTFSTIRKLGYTGVEIAPFTFAPHNEPFDLRHVSAQKIVDVRTLAEDAGLEIIGLHWVLAKTEGYYLTSPDPNVRRRTGDYLKTLVEVCADLGGKVVVVGSPKQRNLLPGVSYEDAEEYAASVLRAAMAACKQYGVTIGVEPLGPAEGDFLLTAESGIRLVEMVESPHCKLHLDVKAMSSESKPIPDIIRNSRDWLVHFHANDPNMLGPGMGDVDFHPIFAALNEISYDGWVSVEVFKYDPSPDEIARQSIEYMRKVESET